MKKLILIILLLIPFLLQGATYNVTNYGAKPDDGSDDTIGINAAITASAVGDTIYIPVGVYEITNSIFPKDSSTMYGDDRITTIIQYKGDTKEPLLDFTSNTNIEVYGFTLDGDHNTNVINGITAQNSSGHFIHDLKFMDYNNLNAWGPRGIHFSINVTHSVISNNLFNNIGASNIWGCAILINHESAHNRIVYNNITNVGRGGILCNDGSTNLVIQHNTIIKMLENDGMGIEVFAHCNNTLVEHNIMDYWLSIDDSDGCAIRNNIISEKTGNFSYCGLELAVGENNIFTDNLVDDGSKIGISIGNTQLKKYCFFGYNTIKAANTWGLQMMGETAGAFCIYFYNNIFRDTTRNTPKALYQGEGHGFRFNGHCEYITLEKNYIACNACMGIQFCGASDDQLSFFDNTIVSNAGDSSNPCNFDDLEWTNNIVLSNFVDRQYSSTGFTNTKPTASFSSLDTVTVGVPINFTDTSIDNGSIVHRLWDFDDGLPSTSSTPSYTYNTTGNYRVTLIVWDDEGRGARVEKTITVRSKENVIKEGKRFKVQFSPVIMKQMGRDLDKGLEGHWSMSSSDTNADGRMDDLSSNTNYLTFISNAVFVTNHLDEENGAVLFNGTNDYIYSEDMPVLSVFSVSTWLKMDDTDDQCSITKNYNNAELSHDWMILSGNDRRIKISTWIGGYVQISSVNQITLNTWNHVVMTFDENDKLSLYLNGDKEISANKSGDIDSVSQPISWGAYNLGGTKAYKRSYFADSRLYNRCLTAWEVRKLYYNTKE